MLGSGEVRLLRRDVARIGKTGRRVEWLARRDAFGCSLVCCGWHGAKNSERSKKMNIKTGYQWKNDKCCYKATADEAAGAFEEIRQNSGKLTPELVVDYARPKESVLHDDFEWRDEVAAEKYRQGQARHMIGAIRITSEDTQEPVRAYVNVTVVAPDEPPVRSYMPMKEVLEHPDLHSQMMADAFRDAQSFKQKYNTLERLKPVMDAMDKAFDGAV
nr:MAG TPA: hypothetical protein [Caudoviricetes sp.]